MKAIGWVFGIDWLQTAEESCVAVCTAPCVFSNMEVFLVMLNKQ